MMAEGWSSLSWVISDSDAFNRGDVNYPMLERTMSERRTEGRAATDA
jgi:hypothetical protein